MNHQADKSLSESQAAELSATYPEPLLQELLRAGEEPDRALLDRVKAAGPTIVPSLIAMATDERLNNADSDSAEVWAPIHALELLGELRATESIEPLLPLFGLDNDVLGDTLPVVYGQIGEAAIEPMRTLLFDRSKDVWARVRAASALVEAAKYHPELRSRAIEILVERLSPAESRTPDDETIDGFIIADLLDLKPTEALPAIRQAFAEDRVDTTIVRMEDVVRELDLPLEPGLEIRKQPQGMLLQLRCTACGYQRQHDVETVYYDIPTAERRERGEKVPYSPYVIPQRIVCPKCGALDQYELGDMGHVKLAAEMVKTSFQRKRLSDELVKELPGLAEEARLVPVRFRTSDGREMNPFEARDLLRDRVATQPDRVDLRLRYAKILRFLGYRDEAISEYQAALRLAPTSLEADLDLGLLARDEGNLDEARRRFERIVELAPRSGLPLGEREEYTSAARDELDALPGSSARGLVEELNVGQKTREPVRPNQPMAGSRTAARAVPKVGRNEPCPCGSGKKYKKCHGR